MTVALIAFPASAPVTTYDVPVAPRGTPARFHVIPGSPDNPTVQPVDRVRVDQSLDRVGLDPDGSPAEPHGVELAGGDVAADGLDRDGEDLGGPPGRLPDPDIM